MENDFKSLSLPLFLTNKIRHYNTIAYLSINEVKTKIKNYKKNNKPLLHTIKHYLLNDYMNDVSDSLNILFNLYIKNQSFEDLLFKIQFKLYSTYEYNYLDYCIYDF